MTFLKSDPRYYQIMTLSLLLCVGLGYFHFDLDIIVIPLLLMFSLGTQFFCCSIVKTKFDPLSPIITSLSLCLLLRTGELWIALLAAVVAISSKFILRINNKHIFNPANIGIILVIYVTDAAWISPGQWGNGLWFTLLLACLAGLVLYRANRYDVSITFLSIYSLCLFGRAWWLGDPWAIPWHQLQSGTLLLFVFFMISDPKTIPNHQFARVVFASATAFFAYFLQFECFLTTGLLLSLTIMCLFTPILDLLWSGGVYTWQESVKRNKSYEKN